MPFKHLYAHAFFYDIVLTEYIWQDFGMFNESDVEDYLIQLNSFNSNTVYTRVRCPLITEAY